jgi:C-terminal processing protease CtpA/Prc
MARHMAEAVRKYYYDPAYHGIDVSSRFKAADEKIQKAPNLGQAFGAIAEAVDALNDSHTFFHPPSRSTRRESGYLWTMVGDDCFITGVRPKSDASQKLKPGDQVLSVERFRVRRTNFWKIGYSINHLYSLPVVHMTVRSPDGDERQVEVAAKMEQGKRVLNIGNGDDIWQVIIRMENEDRLNRQRYVESGDAVMIWKMPQFDLSEDEVNNVMNKARAHKSLILDLRGNPGGYEKTLQAMIGGVMDHGVTIAKRQGRKPDLKPVIAKTRGGSAFRGKLFVLIDGRSASAAELFARVIQLEHRGTVLGDRSSGKVMESRYYPFSQGAYTQMLYGASITEADLVMADGKSLEHTGVLPDEMLLPTAKDLAEERDPVLAKAAALAGLALDPAAAAKMFPVEW